MPCYNACITDIKHHMARPVTTMRFRTKVLVLRIRSKCIYIHTARDAHTTRASHLLEVARTVNVHQGTSGVLSSNTPSFALYVTINPLKLTTTESSLEISMKSLVIKSIARRIFEG